MAVTCLRLHREEHLLILCSQKSEAVVKYSVLTDSEQLFAAKYLPYLPTEAELKHELDRLKVQSQLMGKIR